MENKIRNLLEETINKPGVTGVAIADQNGLCLGSKGTLNSSACGSLVHLMQMALKLEPEKYPVLKLETDTSSITVKTDGNVFIALSSSNRK